MHAAVAQMTHSGAPAAIKGSAASCALPAYTATLMSIASGNVKPLLIIATPVTSAHAEMPNDGPAISRTPRKNSSRGFTALCDRLRLAQDGSLVRCRVRRHERRVDVALVRRYVDAVEIKLARDRRHEPRVVNHARHVAHRYPEAQL